MRDAHGAATRIGHYPFQFRQTGKEGYSQCTAKMMAPFGPIETGPGRGTLATRGCREKDAEPAAPFVADSGQFIAVSRRGYEQLAIEKRPIDPDRQRAREMAVATAGETKFPDALGFRPGAGALIDLTA